LALTLTIAVGGDLHAVLQIELLENRVDVVSRGALAIGRQKRRGTVRIYQLRKMPIES